MQFDVRAAKALMAGQHLIIGGAQGLRLEASTVGRSWIYRYKSPVDGRMRQIKLGTWPTMSAMQAGAEWERLRGERDAGRDPSLERKRTREATPPVPEAAPGTVGSLIDDYVEWAAGRRVTKGAAELRRTMAKMLDAKFRALTPAEITRSTAYDLISKFSATPVQASSLRRELGAAWEWGHDSGRLADTVPNWWRLILRGKLTSAGKIVDGKHQGVSKRVLSVEEVGAIIRHLPHIARQPAELITLYLWTGCRGAELVQMEGREVSQDADGQWWWTVPRSKLKMGRHPLATDLPVPLIGRARDVVLARKDLHGDAHLFPPVSGKAQHVDQKVVGVAVYWHMPRCGIRPESSRSRWPVVDWAPHDLRRTVRTQLARMGCPEAVAEAVLGHIDPDVGVYDRHDYRTERLHWLSKLARAWEGAASR